MNNRHSKGFTLIELMVVISIIALLATTILSSLNVARKRSRDARRLLDMKTLTTALQLYYSDHSAYPEETTPDGSLAGWEVSYKGDFMEYLRDGGYIGRVPLDPLNQGNEPINMFFSPRPQDGNYFYTYYNYPSGTAYGCPWTGPFSVLGFRAAEDMDTSSFPKARCGPMPCPNGGTANVCRDWSNEFDYSIFLTR